MKRTLLIAALAAILSTGAQAHIGWSLSDCKARYGAEVKPSKNTNSGEINYFSVQAAGLTLSVILRNDKVKSIIYRKAGEKFSLDEIDILQKLNQKEILGCEGIKWTEQTDPADSTRVWVLNRDGDHQLQALLSNGSLNDQKFEIRTWDQSEVETKAIRLDKLDQLQGM
jgi:hypothetical protein